MPPRDYHKEYNEKVAAFEKLSKELTDLSYNDAMALVKSYEDIQEVVDLADYNEHITFNTTNMEEAFSQAAMKFGKPFWGEFQKIPHRCAETAIRRLQEDIIKTHPIETQVEKDFFEMMEISSRADYPPDASVIARLYNDTREIIGDKRADRIFETDQMDKLAPSFAKQQRAEIKRQRQEANENEIFGEADKRGIARNRRQVQAEEERYEKLASANKILKNAFDDDDISDKLKEFLDKKETDLEKVDEVHGMKTDRVRKKISTAISEDINFLEKLQSDTEKMYNYGHGENKIVVSSTIRIIKDEYPEQLDRLFKTLPNDAPGSTEYKGHLAMIRAGGAMLVNTQRFAKAAAENGEPIKGFEDKDPMATARDILKKFSTELERVPKDDDDSELYTNFKDALKAAANGGSLDALSDASKAYYNARQGIIFGPFTDVGKHRLDVADHVFDFLEDIHYSALVKESQKKAEQPKAEEKKADQPTDARIENGRKGTQNILNGDREALIARFQKLGLPREVIEEQLNAALESNQQNNDAPVNEQPQLNDPANEQPQASGMGGPG